MLSVFFMLMKNYLYPFFKITDLDKSTYLIQCSVYGTIATLLTFCQCQECKLPSLNLTFDVNVCDVYCSKLILKRVGPVDICDSLMTLSYRGQALL